MKFKTDLHIHTVLSPCGHLDMSPRNILQIAKDKGLNIIGITDHNSTLNAQTTLNLAVEYGIHVVCGAEVTTKEEVHCLCFMPDEQRLRLFQYFLDSRIVFIKNDIKRFGYQLVVDKDENILDQIPHLLINALDCGIEELSNKVKELDGIFIPAHIDRENYSISSQLGFIPENLHYDALELSRAAEGKAFFSKFPWFSEFNYIRSSDAHFLNDIGRSYSELNMDSYSFENLRNALKDLK